ncbi:uncharacterized protein LOC119613622 [Lucilia sericata]|uniref:uncharacterized protein LOC119613622 n=1 Tax=Lucilia sericata TaxID=13632 RepID=UPI0018A8710C|nr:uncharacterized protein LOC119613622 [Lucilia sericata]
MSKSKICTIFMVLVLAQAALSKSVDSSNSVESSEESIKNLNPKQRLVTYIAISVVGMVQEYSEKCMNVSRNILNDVDFLAHHEPMVVEFKNNLTQFVEATEANKDMEKMFDFVDMFSNTTDFYYEIPEDKLTPEHKYIMEVLNKHHYKNIEIEMTKEFAPVAEQFMKMFNEYKSDLDKPMLDWYEKYQHIDDFEDKLEAFTEFIKMADD